MIRAAIKRKKCKCGCGKWPTLGFDGYFSAHAPQNIKDKNSDRVKLNQKNRNARMKIRNLLPSKEDENLMELWFKMVGYEIAKNPHCWETGDYIEEKYYKAASAHILPKAIFNSVKTHPLNFLVLSAGNGSHDQSHRLDTFCKMKVWPIAVERLKQIFPYVKEKHKLLNHFKQLVKEYDEKKNDKMGLED